MARFFFCLLFTFSSPSFANGKLMFSSDCQSWKPQDESDHARKGFLKTGSEKLYFDLTKNLWLKLGAKPLAFIENGNEVFILSDSSVEFHSLRGKYKNEVIKLIETSMAIVKEMATEHRWTLRSKDGQTQLAALFMGSSKCSVEPKAVGIVCSKEKSCFLGPSVNEPQKNAKACAEELGLLDKSRFGRLTKACEVISRGTAYKSIDESFKSASLACGQEKPPVLPLKTLKTMCEDVGHLTQQLERL